MKFDTIVGHLEDILISECAGEEELYSMTIELRDLHRFGVYLSLFLPSGPEFQHLQQQFMQENYEQFEDTEENKLVYMDVFKNYV